MPDAPAPTRSPILLKLGGSVITDKAHLKTLRPRVLARLAREAAEGARAAGAPLVVVHGAGSFGHVRAKRHGLQHGATGAAGQTAALAEVHADVRELHAHVLAALRRAGLPAVGVSPVACARLSEGSLAHLDLAPFTLALAAGLVPVTFGDAVLDATRGFGILSGDVLVERLAPALGAARAVYATDVDGIYDRSPTKPGARLLAHAGPKDLESIAWGVTRPDVTRGMGGKLDAVAALAREGVPVTIVNGNRPGRVADALAGKRVEGTRVEAPA